MTRFHDRTFDLLDQTPRLTTQAAAALAAVESSIGRPLPASLREWYSFEGAGDLLWKHSNEDPPVPLDKLGRGHDGGVCSALHRHNLLIFRHENQGVCTWAARLNGAEDPPVVIAYDNDRDFTNPLQVSPTFSEHVYTSVWDYAKVLACPFLVQAQNVPLTEVTERELGARFQQVASTQAWPGDAQRRFTSGTQHLLIWASPNQADWFLAADTEEGLADLIAQVKHLDNLGQSLWAKNEASKRVLMRAGCTTQG